MHYRYVSCLNRILSQIILHEPMKYEHIHTYTHIHTICWQVIGLRRYKVDIITKNNIAFVNGVVLKKSRIVMFIDGKFHGTLFYLLRNKIITYISLF